MRRHQLLTLLTLFFLDSRADAAPPIPSVNIIYSFTNGTSPGPVAFGPEKSLYTVTATGGPSTNGGIIEVSSNGALIRNIWFDGKDGATPVAPLTVDSSGNVYGAASRGGISNNGVVFKISNGQFAWTTEFRYTNGSTPMGQLLPGTNGWYYGTTFNGGSNYLGGIYRITTGGMLSNVYSFNGTDGANPVGGLIQWTNGNLYGTTAYGGANGLGTIFEITYSNVLTTLYSFTNSTGAFPGQLAMDKSGNLYVATVNGGSNYSGDICRFTPPGSTRVLLTFNVFNGANPNSPLIPGTDGYMYGTTEQGGARGEGTVFRFNSKGTVQTDLLSFAGTNGGLPKAGLVQGADGNFYGTATSGGAYSNGVIYELAGFPPSIVTPPANQAYASNHTATFSVQAAGSAPLSYQWLHGGIEIADATNSSLVISHEQLTNSGTYTATVSNAFGAVSASAVLTVVPPSVTIATLPATVANSLTTISGTATGPYGISSVLYNLNSNGWVAATGTNKWQIATNLIPGTNKFQVESFDPIGDSSGIKSVTLFYSETSPLTLQTSGLGSIRTNFSGTNLVLTRNYTMRAVPDSGWLFESWTGSITATNGELSFVMKSNLVITANFVTNPFIAAAGTYAGLFIADGGAAEPSAGLLSRLTVKTTGAFSGRVVVKGVACGFTGGFDAAKHSSVTVARTAAQGGPLAMSLTLASNEITGVVSGTDSGGWTSTLTAERATEPLGSAEFTMLIPPTNAPAGFGYMLATNHGGAVTLNGALADGATFSQTTPIVGNGDIPFYASLYGRTGLILGWLNFNGVLTATNLEWIKSGTNGFTNVITNVLTSAWIKPPANYLATASLDIANNSLSLDFIVSITNTSLVKRTGSPTNSLTGTFYPATGLLRIIFGNGEGRGTSTGYAAILGDSNNGGGYFLLGTNAGAITLQPQ